MSDARLRSLEREPDDPAAAAEALATRLRAGELAEGSLELLALAGDEAALAVYGPSLPHVPDERGQGLSEWLLALHAHHPASLRRALLGASWPAIRGLPSGAPRRGWESGAWLALSRLTLCPCRVHLDWLLSAERQREIGNWGRFLDLRRAIVGTQAVRALFELAAARLSWTRVLEGARADLRAWALAASPLQDPLRASWKSATSWLSPADLLQRLQGAPQPDLEAVLDPAFPYLSSQESAAERAARALAFEPPLDDPPQLPEWAREGWAALGPQAEFDAFSV